MNDVAGANFANMSVDSKYYDLESLSTSCMASDSFQYKAMHFNIRGMARKFNDLKG